MNSLQFVASQSCCLACPLGPVVDQHSLRPQYPLGQGRIRWIQGLGEVQALPLLVLEKPSGRSTEMPQHYGRLPAAKLLHLDQRCPGCGAQLLPKASVV